MTIIWNGDARNELKGLTPGSVDCVITDPVWPNNMGMFGVEDPELLLRETLSVLPDGVKRIVIVVRSDSDPRFLRAVPSKWPFFHAAWMMYAMPGYYGRRLGGNEIAYCFGDPVRSAHGRRVIPGVCARKAQPAKDSQHPCRRAQVHMDWLVEWWSDPGEMILDPFAGTGTVGIAAQRLGRDAHLIEIDPTFVDVCRRRIEEAAPLLSEVHVA